MTAHGTVKSPRVISALEKGKYLRKTEMLENFVTTRPYARPDWIIGRNT